jgi:hypothetical protein
LHDFSLVVGLIGTIQTHPTLNKSLLRLELEQASATRVSAVHASAHLRLVEDMPLAVVILELPLQNSVTFKIEGRRAAEYPGKRQTQLALQQQQLQYSNRK